jgi:predicted adenylyl cyclase CyaB
MSHLNIEIKAKSRSFGFIREYLKKNQAEFKGTDHQTDTYFNVSRGRLKLREGNIENNLIYYERNDETGMKESNFHLINIPDAKGLKEILTRSSGIKIIIEKKREIYFIENVKFHIDEVKDLGSFVEIEASNLYANVSQEKLRDQCQFYLREFGIKDEDLVGGSYSDLLLAGELSTSK